MEARTWVIGDIHGAYQLLKQVLEKAGLNKNDQLIFLGDYVDGWPESYQVVEYLISLSKTYSCIFIKGNHDLWCASWLAGNTPDKNWLENKGSTTVSSYNGVSQNQKLLHLDFFNNLRDYFIDDENRLFIHAGFTDLKGPAEEPFSYHFNNDRTLLETALAMDKKLDLSSVFYPKRLKIFYEIYIGHTPTTKYDINIPINAGNLWDIDTGVSQGGKISVMNIDTKEFWQSDLAGEFYN